MLNSIVFICSGWWLGFNILVSLVAADSRAHLSTTIKPKTRKRDNYCCRRNWLVLSLHIHFHYSCIESLMYGLDFYRCFDFSFSWFSFFSLAVFDELFTKTDYCIILGSYSNNQGKIHKFNSINVVFVSIYSFFSIIDL